MQKKTRKLTFCAVMSALSVVFIYFSAVFPTGQMGFLGIASLMGVAAVIEYGAGGGAAVYVITSVLSLLIAPNKTLAFVYVLFFGYYPLLKLFCEKAKSRITEYILKLIVFNAAAAVMIFALSVTLIDVAKLGGNYVILFAVLNAIFVIFDLGVTQAIGVYINKIKPRLFK